MSPVTDTHNSALQCPISGDTGSDVFVEVSEVPVLCNSLYSHQEDAVQTARGDLRLAYFEHSGHIYNVAFDPDKITYSNTYENSLHHSERFQKYATSLADRLIETYDVRDGTVVDIGCGNGEFLSLLCERGDNTGIGYDPSYEPTPTDDDRPFTIVPDHYSEEYAEHPADFICCRHVLEHVSDPLAFLRTIRRAIGDRSESVVYFEVPNGLFTFQELAVWDLIYEHCSYFTPASLTYVFRRAGFDVIRVEDAFDGQYLQIEAKPGEPVEKPFATEVANPNPDSNAVDRFAKHFQEKINRWRTLCSEITAKNQRAVLWGAGSKGVTILNLIPEAAGAIEYVVDINPEKQGKHVAGTGQQIIPPTALSEYQPDLVVLMNGVYEHEIRNTVSRLGLDPEFVVAT